MFSFFNNNRKYEEKLIKYSIDGNLVKINQYLKKGVNINIVNKVSIIIIFHLFNLIIF
jgi:hypothetical protein